MFVTNNLEKRLNLNDDSGNYQHYGDKYSGLKNMQTRLNVRGGIDQWTRMRQDKLKSLNKALLSSYQSAVVQKYNVNNNSLVKNIISIITALQDQKDLSTTQIELLNTLEEKYSFITTDRNSVLYINDLQGIVDSLIDEQPYFRCLINHDKLKVDYEDKIISIPFSEPPIGFMDAIETDFHNGTVFKWVHGNKQEWTPDTYWIVYMQYSEETAYFRAEIRKADEQIEIIVIDDEGNESTVSYRGWMTGPNETRAIWHTKKGVVWNDMNYTKLLYITKDENTLAFFQRFDRLIINGKPWQVQAYNENYSVNKSGNSQGGIIRVALKQTYTNNKQFVKQTLEKLEEKQQEEMQENIILEQPYIEGPASAKPFSIVKYKAKNFNNEEREWNISADSSIAKMFSISQDGKTVMIEIVTGYSNKEGFYINYGDSEETKIKVTIESL